MMKLAPVVKSGFAGIANWSWNDKNNTGRGRNIYKKDISSINIWECINSSAITEFELACETILITSLMTLENHSNINS